MLGVGSLAEQGSPLPRWCPNWRIHTCTAREDLAEVEEAARAKPTKEVPAGASVIFKRGHMDFPLPLLNLK